MLCSHPHPTQFPQTRALWVPLGKPPASPCNTFTLNLWGWAEAPGPFLGCWLHTVSVQLQLLSLRVSSQLHSFQFYQKSFSSESVPVTHTHTHSHTHTPQWLKLECSTVNAHRYFAGKDWRQEEKGVTEDEVAGWHHRLDGHEFE